MVTPCTLCQQSESLSVDEIIIAFGLKGRKDESKNCCETGGYMCSVLDRLLVNARKKGDSKRLLEKKRIEKQKLRELTKEDTKQHDVPRQRRKVKPIVPTNKGSKLLRKRQLNLDV